MKTILILLMGAMAAHAQLAVTVSPVKATGQKAIVPLTMKNGLGERVESARATVFLLDEQGKVVGQATQWVIGGTKDRPALEPGKETKFNLVVMRRASKAGGQTVPQLKAKVAFTRLVLAGSKSVDPGKSVQIRQSSD